jgi:hypothetical protein
MYFAKAFHLKAMTNIGMTNMGIRRLSDFTMEESEEFEKLYNFAIEM